MAVGPMKSAWTMIIVSKSRKRMEKKNWKHEPGNVDADPNTDLMSCIQVIKKHCVKQTQSFNTVLHAAFVKWLTQTVWVWSVIDLIYFYTINRQLMCSFCQVMTDTVEKLIAIAHDTKWRIVGSIEWYLQEKKERKKERKKKKNTNR